MPSPTDRRSRDVPAWTGMPATKLAEEAATWRELNRRHADSPLLDPDFLLPAISRFGSGEERLCLAHDDEGPVAGAIVARARPGVWNTFQPSQAPIGPLVLARPGSAAAALWSLQRSVSRSCLLLGITQQDPDLSPRPGDGGRWRTMDYIETSRVTVDGSFDDYWGQRGKNLRQNLRRQRNRLRREETTTRLHLEEDPAAMAEAVRDYAALETRSWKAREGTAVREDDAQGRFYRTVLEGFGRRRAAHVYRYFYGDRLAAMDLCISQGGAIVILKTTYDESIQGTSPAMLMREEAFRQIFAERRFRRIEFYGRVMDWHRRWTTEMRVMYHLEIARWRWLAAIRRRSSGRPSRRATEAPPAA